MSDPTDEEMAAEYDRAREYDKPPSKRTWKADARIYTQILEDLAAMTVRGGFPHNHTTLVAGCFRCELNQDEEGAS